MIQGADDQRRKWQLMGVAAGYHHGWWREEEELRLWAEKNQAVGDGRVNHQRGKGNNGWSERDDDRGRRRAAVGVLT